MSQHEESTPKNLDTETSASDKPDSGEFNLPTAARDRLARESNLWITGPSCAGPYVVPAGSHTPLVPQA